MSAAPAPTSLARRIGLYTGGFIGPFGGGMVTVLIPEFRDAFDVSTTTASLSLTVYVIPFAAFQVFSGTLGERVGRDRVLRIAFLVYAAASFATAITPTIVPFLIGRAIQGSANAFTSPLALAKLAVQTPEEDLGKAMGTYSSVQTFGVVMAPLIGGLAGAFDYRLAFVFAGVVALILMVIVPQKQPKPNPAHVPSLRSALTPRTKWLCVSGAFFYLCTVGLGVIVSLKAADEFGINAETRGLLLGSFGFAGVLVGRPSGALIDRFGLKRVLIGSIGATAAILSLLAAADNEYLVTVLWFLTGGASAMLGTSLNTLIVGASARNRGGAISLIGTFRFIGAAFAPLIWVPAYQANPHLAFMLAAVGTGVIAFSALRAITASVGPPALGKKPELQAEAL